MHRATHQARQAANFELRELKGPVQIATAGPTHHLVLSLVVLRGDLGREAPHRQTQQGRNAAALRVLRWALQLALPKLPLHFFFDLDGGLHDEGVSGLLNREDSGRLPVPCQLHPLSFVQGAVDPMHQVEQGLAVHHEVLVHRQALLRHRVLQRVVELLHLELDALVRLRRRLSLNDDIFHPLGLGVQRWEGRGGGELAHGALHRVGAHTLDVGGRHAYAGSFQDRDSVELELRVGHREVGRHVHAGRHMLVFLAVPVDFVRPVRHMPAVCPFGWKAWNDLLEAPPSLQIPAPRVRALPDPASGACRAHHALRHESEHQGGRENGAGGGAGGLRLDPRRIALGRLAELGRRGSRDPGQGRGDDESEAGARRGSGKTEAGEAQARGREANGHSAARGCHCSANSHW
mmetsp:Transcript_62601/g.179578  ORF Transcript_62601/g.179578 Transcript_62601/m.179578 type:complete len:405 (+) Transcript_62601:706-1920(+)